MRDFVFNTTRSLVFRSGAAADLAGACRGVLTADVLVVTDPGIRALGLADPALASLRAAGCRPHVFAEVEADPSLSTLLRAVAVGRQEGATSVLGFGGGSSLDVAKLAALLIGSGEDLDAAWGVGNAVGPRLPLALVPTTAGTGSEATPVAIITVGAEEKRGVSSPLLLPDVAILDADLTLTLPPLVTAATGLDAMVHAIEAYSSASLNNNPLSKLLAREALRLLGGNIREAVAAGGNRAAREAMLLGATLAGRAFANSPVAAVHALAYPLGGTFHVPHGLANAMLLAHVLRFNAVAAPSFYEEIAADAFPHLADIKAPDRSLAFVAAIETLLRDLQVPTRLRDVGIPPEALEQLARDAMKQQRLLVNNPRPVTLEAALSIYAAAW